MTSDKVRSEGCGMVDRLGLYATHHHQCNVWCRPPLHAGLTYSRQSTDISEVIRSDYKDMGY